VQGEGLLAVGFTHRTSRAGDPLLHTHLIITNRIQGPDGLWRTLDSRDLLAHRATADAMYRAAYQAELTRTLGVRWQEPDRWGNRAIQGMPEELRCGFSKRHEQIAAELQRQEAQGKHRTAKLVQMVVHATRPPKSRETPETLYGRWQEEARALGYEPERLVREVIEIRERSREQGPAGTMGHLERSAGTPAGTAGLPERTITTMFDRLASPEGLTAQASTFTRPQVLCAVGRELPAEAAGTVGPAELERLADRFLAERAVSVVSDHALGERRYATPGAAGGRAAAARRRGWPRRRAGRRVLPRQRAGRAGGQPEHRGGPGGDGPRHHPGRPGRVRRGRQGRHRQDLRAGGRPARLAA
jgi:TrwC relaxase